MFPPVRLFHIIFKNLYKQLLLKNILSPFSDVPGIVRRRQSRAAIQKQLQYLVIIFMSSQD